MRERENFHKITSIPLIKKTTFAPSMHYVSVENLTKSFVEKPLFTNITFNIEQGDKIALVAKMVQVKPHCCAYLQVKTLPIQAKFG